MTLELWNILLFFFSDIRYCDKCRLVKPDRSHHCSACRRCVLKMDHHCPMVNNCISYSNYKFFILCLSYGFLMCIFVIATTVEYVVKFLDVTSDLVILQLLKIIIILIALLFIYTVAYFKFFVRVVWSFSKK